MAQDHFLACFTITATKAVVCFLSGLLKCSVVIATAIVNYD